MKEFTKENTFEILSYLKEKLQTTTQVQIQVLNPNTHKKAYLGQKIFINNTEYIYRSFRVWNDLAELLYCKLFIEKIENETIILLFQKIHKNTSFHNVEKNNIDKKYGINSQFFKINKNEDPNFLFTYINALKNIQIEKRKVILNLGINKADEFEVITQLLSKEDLESTQFYGVDFSKSAIEFAKDRFKSSNFNFFCHDIKNLESLALPKADLLISIASLQSVSSNFKVLFMSIVQNYLKKDGAMILAFPNCRWIDGDSIYGAKSKNYSYSEFSVLFNDIIFCKKYLQQKGFRVTLTGKSYIFLTASSLK